MKKHTPLPKNVRAAFKSRVPTHPRALPDSVRAEFESSARELITQTDGPLGNLERYWSAALKAMGVACELDENKIYHHLGSLDVRSSIPAINALVQVYHFERKPHNHVFAYEHYLDALKRVSQIERQLEAIENHRQRQDERRHQYNEKYSKWADSTSENKGPSPNFYEQPEPDPPSDIDLAFLSGYDLREYTPDLKGYLYYLSFVAPDLEALTYASFPYYQEENPDRPHGYVLGVPGSGKSELLKLIIHTYVTNEKYGSVVVIDPTSDFVTQIARWKEFNTSDRLVYIRPTLAKGMTPIINPFEIEGVRADDYSEDALNIKRVVAQELVEAIGRIVSETGSRITGPMSTLLINCVLILLDRPNSTLEDLARFMKGDEELMEFAGNIQHNSYLAEYFQEENTGFNMPTNKPTKEAVSRRLDELLSIGTFKRLTCGKSTFSLVKAVNEKKVILFDLSKGSIGDKEGSAFGRLVIAMLLGMAYRRENVPKKLRVPCSLVVDECHNYVSESIGDILVEARKYRLLVTLAQQTAGQKMPHELKDAVLQNTNLQAVGGTTPAGAKRNGEIAGVSPDEILQLGIGEFYVRPSRSLPAVKFKTRSDLLDDNNCVTDRTWERIVADQKKQYYQSQDDKQSDPVEEEPDTSPAKW